jgi:hypothetical protein
VVELPMVYDRPVMYSSVPIMSSSSVSPLIIIPIVIVVVIITQYALLRKYDFKCGNCGHVFSPSFMAVLLTPHSFGRKRLRCPACGKVTWATRVPKAQA